MNWKLNVVFLAVLLLTVGGLFGQDIQTQPLQLAAEQIAQLKKQLAGEEKQYDPDKKMIRTITKEKHYHSDLDSGVAVHDTRASAQYAAALMHTADPVLIRRCVDIVSAILPLQEKDTSQPYAGVWPYYPEDPLQGRKAPVDYNWADFMSVALIDVVINGAAYLNQELKQQIKEALILASGAIKKRDVKADYTNICIMGTYVCYMVGNLYELPDVKQYARNKLAYFYRYTKANKGFTEYNSPTYSVVALDELLRMKQAILRPTDKQMVEELYEDCWRLIARHFHRPSGQWAGPYLRAYANLMTLELKQLFYNASGGKIDFPGNGVHVPRVLAPHKMSEETVQQFLHAALPREVIDTFSVGRLQAHKEGTYLGRVIAAKDITGKLYSHPQYALASVNTGYLWNQSRPLIVHWGTPDKPASLQVRFLHDRYDLAAAHIKNAQDSSTVLSIINVAFDGGDRHPGIDRIRDRRIRADDLRLRFETEGAITNAAFSILDTDQVLFRDGALQLLIRLPYCHWTGLSGHWETGGTGNRKWADYVLYSGAPKTFDLSAMEEAVIGFSLSVLPPGGKGRTGKIRQTADPTYLHLSINRLMVKALKKPADVFRIKNDFEINTQ